MKLTLASFCMLLSITSILHAQTEPTDTDGDGYYNISTLDHLRWVSENESCWSWNFELDNDIDASDTKNWNNGAGFSPIGDSVNNFTGIFYGNGYAVDSLYVNRPYQDYIGLFGYTSESVIKNIGVANCNIIGGNWVAGLVGISSSSSITNSFSTGSLYGDNVVGGLVGQNFSNITNSYATGSVTGDYHVGGLVGSCGDSATTANSFWDTQRNGEHFSSCGGKHKTTAEMKIESTFTDADWDFEAIWAIDGVTNDGYPYFGTTTGVVTENLLSTTNLTCSPNPCSTSSKTGYYVNNVGFVNIAVYDMLGNEVAVLINNYQSAIEHEIFLNPEELSAGVYFISINTAATMETKKIIVAR